MKFIKFNDWLIKINEETKEERFRREKEAEKRQQDLEKHLDKEEEIKSMMRASGMNVNSISAQDLEAKYNFRKKLPNNINPSEEFLEKVYDNIEEKTGFHYLYNFPDNPKGNADANRVHELVWDCYDDGTTVEEATSMVIDLLKKMNYI
jgi:hypothetical protein